MTYTIIGAINLNKKKTLLMIGEDNKWYKSFIIGEYQDNDINSSILKHSYSEITELTKKEFNSYFK